MNKIRITNIRAYIRDDAGILLHDLHNRAHLHEQDAINRLTLQVSIASGILAFEKIT